MCEDTEKKKAKGTEKERKRESYRHWADAVLFCGQKLISLPVFSEHLPNNVA